MSTPAPIGALFHRERPSDHAIILGKGPSLDAYLDTEPRASAYVLALNEVGLACKCDGVVFSDTSFAGLEFPRTIDIIRHTRWIDGHDGRGYAFWRRRHVTDEPEYAAEYELPWRGFGTLACAITILGEWGYKHLDMWGCDALVSEEGARKGYARVLDGVYTAPASDAIYLRRRDGAKQALGRYRWKWAVKGV